MTSLKTIALTLLSCVGLGAQWLTGFYSAQNGILPVSNIPWNLYTHIVHFAAAPSAAGDGTLDLRALTQAEISAIVTAKPPGKKLLVCIKDNDSSAGAFALSTSSAMIATFVSNIVNFVNSNGYDGVDIDWEHNVRVAQYEDLLGRLRNAMPTKSITMDAGNWSGLDTVAAASQSQLDQVNIMCYDMDLGGQNCNGQDCTWYNAPLFQNGQADKRACDWRVRAFTSAGVQAQKIGVGIPFYARRWVGAILPQLPGEFQTYTLAYRDLAADPIRWQEIFKRYDTGFKADYLSISALNEFISYTGPHSIADTVAWGKSQGFGGFMTFTLEYEYLAGQTSDARYPLSAVLYSRVFVAAP